MLVDRTFLGEPMDLVVDDASHFYHETRESFRTLFPLLRPGGLYIVEDWGWAHWSGDFWQANRSSSHFSAKPPLSNLLIEVMLLSASRPALVPTMTVNGTVAYIERGPEPIESGFEPSEHYLNRGDPIRLLGVEFIQNRHGG